MSHRLAFPTSRTFRTFKLFSMLTVQIHVQIRLIGWILVSGQNLMGENTLQIEHPPTLLVVERQPFQLEVVGRLDCQLDRLGLLQMMWGLFFPRVYLLICEVYPKLPVNFHQIRCYQIVSLGSGILPAFGDETWFSLLIPICRIYILDTESQTRTSQWTVQVCWRHSAVGWDSLAL